MNILNNNEVELLNVNTVKQFGQIQYYTTTITIKDLVSLYDRLTYDGEAQRGNIQGKPVIDRKHVREIANSFVNGHSIRGHLTWNMRADDSENKFSYMSKSKTLIIDATQMVTLPDSAHRHEALKLIAEEIEDEDVLQSEFTLDIYNLTLEEEKEFFSVVNGKGKTPTNNRILYLSNDIASRLTRDLINNSDLKGRVECVKNHITDGKLVKFSTLYDSLFSKHTGSYYTVSVNEENYNDYLLWFVKYYNALIKSRPEFSAKTKEEKQQVKSESLLLEEISWWGYAEIARELQDKRNWNKTLKAKMNKQENVEGGKQVHFLSKSLPIWHATVIKSKFNAITKQIEVGTQVTNSNTTRHSLKKTFAVML